MSYESMLEDKDILIVQKRLAAAFGLGQSIALRQLRYWQDINQKADKRSHYHAGVWWAYNTYEEWQQHNFPFWSESTIRRYYTEMEKLNVVFATSEFNKLSIDKTKWYTINPYAYNAYMMLWEWSGSPVYSSKEHDKFLNLWQNFCATVQNEQTTVQIEQTICSKWTDHAFKLIAPLPENTAKNSNSEKKEHLSAANASGGGNCESSLFLGVADTHPQTPPDPPKERTRKNPQSVERPRDLIFEALVQHLFEKDLNNKTDVAAVRGRVNKLSKHLTKTLYPDMDSSALAAKIAAFPRWYRAQPKFATASLPLGEDTFATHFSTFMAAGQARAAATSAKEFSL